VVVALFGILVVRLFSIQVVNGASANGIARETVLKDVEVPALRGEIIARGNTAAKVLATNVATWEVTVNQQSALTDPKMVDALVTLLPGTTISSIDQTLAIQDGKAKSVSQFLPYQPVPIATNVKPATVLYIEEHPSLFPGVDAERTYVRSYPDDDLAAQVLGYVGDISSQELQQHQGDGYTQQSQIGQSGLEEQYEAQLHGVPGIQQVTVNPAETAVSTVSTTPAIPGDNLYLNMDIGLEKLTSTALGNQINSLRSSVPADFGSAVVLNAQTGAVLAMASYPSYNNNLWIPSISEKEYAGLLGEYGRPLNNYAISEPEAPGSDFKISTATAALNDGLITANYYYDDTGRYVEGKPPNQTVLQDSDGEVLGEVNVTSALAESSDIFFYNLGALFCQQAVSCPTQIQKYAAEYGFGESTGVDLPNASSGQVDSPQLRVKLHKEDPALYPSTAYYQGDNVDMAFGQGETLVTPLQVADAYATFANGGTRYAPEMAAALVSPSGKVTHIKPKVMGHVKLPASTYQPILKGFEDAVQDTDGTAYATFQGFNFSTWNVSGKTGTATANNTVQPVSWFVAFGGPRNKPAEYVAVVEIDQGGFGAAASAPVVRDIFNYLYKYGVAPLKLPK
jgi:penicillin-binding protein 2